MLLFTDKGIQTKNILEQMLTMHIRFSECVEDADDELDDVAHAIKLHDKILAGDAEYNTLLSGW